MSSSSGPGSCHAGEGDPDPGDTPPGPPPPPELAAVPALATFGPPPHAHAARASEYALAIAGWIIAAMVAFGLAPSVEPWVREVPYLGDIVGDSCELTIIAAFAAVFAVTLMIVALFTPLFSSLIRNSVLGGIDQGFGFFFGG